MSDRRTLIEGMKRPGLEPQREQEFILGAKASSASQSITAPTARAPIAKTPFSTRIRADYAVALKRASLQRQMDGIEPSSINDLLEQALEPWLTANGYLSS